MTGGLSFDKGELAAMREAQTAHMMDTCVIQSYGASGSTDLGRPTYTYTDGDPIDCGFQHVSPREVMQGTRVIMTSARLRLPLTATVKGQDRIKLTHRYGEALSTPEIYEIVGQPKRGPSGYVLDLTTETTGGSESS